jgi:hypothetical protein
MMKIVKCSVLSAGLAMLLMGSMSLAGQSKPATQTAPAKPTRVRAKLDGFDLSPQSGKSANQIGGASRDLGSHRTPARPSP